MKINFSHEHFATVLLPKMVITFQKHLESADETVLTVLKEELDAGNKITNVFQENEYTLVQLVSPFYKQYERAGLLVTISTTAHDRSITYRHKNSAISAPLK